MKLTIWTGLLITLCLYTNASGGIYRDSDPLKKRSLDDEQQSLPTSDLFRNKAGIKEKAANVQEKNLTKEEKPKELTEMRKHKTRVEAKIRTVKKDASSTKKETEANLQKGQTKVEGKEIKLEEITTNLEKEINSNSQESKVVENDKSADANDKVNTDTSDDVPLTKKETQATETEANLQKMPTKITKKEIKLEKIKTNLGKEMNSASQVSKVAQSDRSTDANDKVNSQSRIAARTLPILDVLPAIRKVFGYGQYNQSTSTNEDVSLNKKETEANLEKEETKVEEKEIMVEENKTNLEKEMTNNSEEFKVAENDDTDDDGTDAIDKVKYLLLRPSSNDESEEEGLSIESNEKQSKEYSFYDRYWQIIKQILERPIFE